MTKGLGFLMGKYFHPLTRNNQRRKYEAQQRLVAKVKKDKEYAEMRKKELEKSELEMLALGYVDEKSRRRKQLQFMYEPPQGLEHPKQRDAENENDAIIAEAMKIAEPEVSSEIEKEEDNGEVPASLPENPLRRTDKMEAKFAKALKGAPVAGDFVGANDLDITHRPFGIQLRNVQCQRCGNWGHQKGEKECPLYGIDVIDEDKLNKEDPLTAIKEKQKDLDLKTKVMKIMLQRGRLEEAMRLGLNPIRNMNIKQNEEDDDNGDELEKKKKSKHKHNHHKHKHTGKDKKHKKKSKHNHSKMEKEKEKKIKHHHSKKSKSESEDESSTSSEDSSSSSDDDDDEDDETKGKRKDNDDKDVHIDPSLLALRIRKKIQKDKNKTAFFGSGSGSKATLDECEDMARQMLTKMSLKEKRGLLKAFRNEKNKRNDLKKKKGRK